MAEKQQPSFHAARCFFVRQGEPTKAYFVYFEEVQRGMAEKQPPHHLPNFSISSSVSSYAGRKSFINSFASGSWSEG